MKIFCASIMAFFLLTTGMIVLNSCSRDAAPSSHNLTRLDIRIIESKVGILPGGRSLQDYRRYYAGRSEDGKYFVVGIYIYDSKSGVDIVSYDKLPVIFDGGCDVISVRYNFDDELVDSIKCNGVA
jgi:hypothetical protein